MRRRPILPAVLIAAGLAVLALPHLNTGTPATETTASAPEPGLVVGDVAVAPQTTEPVRQSTSSTLDQPPRTGYGSTSTSAQNAPTNTSTPIPVTVAATTTTTRATDGFEVRVPWLQHIPHETPTWRVELSSLVGDRPALRITLLVVTNRADQLAERRSALAAAKADVLGWLAVKAAAAGGYDVTWLPAAAAAL